MNSQLMFSQFLPFAIILVGMYLILIRPRQKEMKEIAKMISELKSGDKVLTQGGFLGTIAELKDDFVVIKLLDGAKMEITKGSIVRKLEA